MVEEQIFDRLCLEFWNAEASGDRAQRAADQICSLAGLGEGSAVIDYGSGIGQVALALAERGVCVTGVERSEAAILKARQIDHSLCTFIEADWRSYAPDTVFDCAIFWRTTLCAGSGLDFQALCAARRALKSGGVLLVESRHWDRMNRQFQEQSERLFGDGKLVEEHAYDPLTGIQTTKEHYLLNDLVVRRRYQTRRYGFPELRDMCQRAGFRDIDGFDEIGAKLNNESERAVLRARAGGS